MHSGPQNQGTSSAPIAPQADNSAGGRPAGPSLGSHRLLAAALGQISGRRRRFPSVPEGEGPTREEGFLHPDDEPWRGDRSAGPSYTAARPPRQQSVSEPAARPGERPIDDKAGRDGHGGISLRNGPRRQPGGEPRRSHQAAGSSRIDALPPHRQSVPDLGARSGERPIDHVARRDGRTANSQELLNGALHDIGFAGDIRKFSMAVVRYRRDLKMPELATFLQQAAAQFTSRFVTNWQHDIRVRQTWGYATVCNAVSREEGPAGMEACRAMAAQVSRFAHELIDVEPKALALLALSFSRYPRVPACQNGMGSIAEFCCEQSGVLRELDSQSLALLVNGFSKWPEQENSRLASVAVSGEVRRRAERTNGLAGFEPQHLANLVNGFSKWPQETGCGAATVAIASEVGRRAGQANWLCDFHPQELANLVNGFSKWPEAAGCGDGTGAIAGEVLRRGGSRLSALDSQNLANLVNGFSKWPERTGCGAATAVIAKEVLRRGADALSDFTPQGLANLVNGFSKWSDTGGCGAATLAIAGEIRRRASGADRLANFTHQHLANLVNAFSKWPGQESSRLATVAIAGEVRRLANRLSGFDSRDLANLVNGFSKWPAELACAEATVAIACEIRRRADRLSDFTPQALANLVNGFSKRPDQVSCSSATVAIAGELVRRGPGRLSSFAHQHLANLVNGFSKWPDQANCREAALAIAGEVLCRRARRLPGFDSRELANLALGFSKWPDEAVCGDVTVAIAGEMLHRGDRADELSAFSPQDLAHLANGFSKWPKQAGCAAATVALAGEVRRRADALSVFDPQDLANLVGCFSKWPEQVECRRATVAIGCEIRRRADHAGQLSYCTPQSLANLVNGFSKWPDETGCCQATLAIAGEVRRRGAHLTDFTAQEQANLVNGFSKWPVEAGCREATVAIAGDVLRRADRAEQLSAFNPQDLANLVNGFSKWTDETGCGDASVAIAAEVRCRADRTGGLSDFSSQQLAIVLHGFSKWPEQPVCHGAIMDIARGFGAAGPRFSTFTTVALGTIANILGRGVVRGQDAGEIADTALLRDRLHQLAHHLHYASDRLEQADALSIVHIFKALAKAQLHDDLGLLARTGLDRLEALRRTSGFAPENLETMGNLCAALVPLARSSQRALRWHRRQTLNLLNDIQPVVEHKIKAQLKASEAERIAGPNSSRCPALSIYQVLKARAVLEGLYKRPYVDAESSTLKRRRDELHRGTREILASTRGLIEGDLSNMSWNLIAQIEAEGPVEALDEFMAQNAALIQARHPAAVFDVHKVLRAMDHEPRPPEGDAGQMQLPVVDMQGRRLPTEPETRYSIFHRLTSGAVKVVAVQLPGKPSAFMLGRTLSVEGVPYRMDLFGGSKSKPPKKTLAQIAARAPGETGAQALGGKLLAIPYAETAPGTAFEQLSRHWAPFKEAYYYTQRRGFAAPPAIKGLGPHDYALEGAFKLSLLPDRLTGEAHPFRLTGPEGPIALRPHDGCGFIKASLAERMPAVRRAAQGQGLDRVAAFAEARRSSVPASALQHYPRSELVADETREKAKTWLDSREGQELGAEDLFRTVTAGHIDAPGAVAVPSSDDCVHVPTLKSETLTGRGGVLIGRAPYDKANLRPFGARQVRSAGDGDATAAFLDGCVAIQYSFNVAEKKGKELAGDDPMFFAKGILIVVPDKMWPADYAERGLVLSAEDVKSHSSWTHGKDRAKVDTPVDSIGILQATEVFAPGSLVAIPTSEQKKLDGDFDGDAVIIIGDRPQLYEHVRQFDEKEQARGVRSLKPAKSHTPAFKDDSYQFSRARQILATTQDVLETYSCLQRNFLAQSDEARRWFAERAVFGTYEGIHHELRRDIANLLNAEEVRGQDIQDTLARARQEIEVARHPVAREMAALLVTELAAWAAKADQQNLSATVETVDDLSPTVSPALANLFQELAESYPATSEPRDRVQLLLDHTQARIDPSPDGYNPDDLVESTSNLLSLGIKVGTDAYKSDTGTRRFMKKGHELQRLLCQTPGLQPVPYVKSMAATLSQGRFDVDATLEELKDNPTLAACVMEASIKFAAQNGLLPERSGRRPAAVDSDVTVTLSRQEASEQAKIEATRARVEEEAITAAAIWVAESLRQAGIPVNMPHFDRRVRSEGSMAEQLTGLNAPSGSAPQLISNAVRHIFELPDQDFTRGFKKAILAFDERGYAERHTTNWFRMRNPTFSGIQSVLATPHGYRFQVEFHTPASYQAKLANHHTYKQLDQLRRAGGDAPAEQLMQRVMENCQGVPVPDGALAVLQWEAEGERGAGATAALKLRPVGQPSMPQTVGSSQAKEVVAALGSRPVVLVGMPGAGKSSIGPALAKRLQLHFHDTDKIIEKQTHKSISQIFEEQGEGYFREMEAKLIARLLEEAPAVIATGGGALMHEQSRRLIGDKAVSIWLDTKLEVIKKRLKRDTSRPLLRGPDPEQKIAQLIDERRPFYQQADLTFIPPHQQDKKNADPCLSALHAHLCPTRPPLSNSPILLRHQDKP
ncbi:shikimate kinase [Mesorhizobium dulcispinae]